MSINQINIGEGVIPTLVRDTYDPYFNSYYDTDNNTSVWDWFESSTYNIINSAFTTGTITPIEAVVVAEAESEAVVVTEAEAEAEALVVVEAEAEAEAEAEVSIADYVVIDILDGSPIEDSIWSFDNELSFGPIYTIEHLHH